MDDLCIPHPFLLYQLAVITKNREAFFQALNQKRVEEAIRKRQIPITFAQSKSEKGKWTDESVRLLKYLWDARFSASEIAQAVGQSRNAVIGKVHRLQLKGRDKGGADKIIRLKFGSK
ncbi:hypothetical protein ELI25_29630 (plasmid) [Rhizobium ruizarguesonis]|nr:hypothetical protein ELI25_29630 [Rhizobium ruizarguesonis]